MSEIWDSFSEYVKTRLTNPFLATLIVVWIIRNFTFVFSLFNFDSGETRDQKLKYIEHYLMAHETWSELGWNVLISFCVILSSFFLLLLSRALTNGYAFLLSVLNKHTAKSTMIEVEIHNDLLVKYTGLKKERDTLRSESSAHDGQLNDLLSRLTNKTEEASSFESEFNRMKQLEENNNKELTIITSENIKIKDQIEKLLQQQLNHRLETTTDILDHLDSFDPDLPKYFVQNLSNKISDTNYGTDLLHFSMEIDKNFHALMDIDSKPLLSIVQKKYLYDIYKKGKLLDLIYYINFIAAGQSFRYKISVDIIDEYFNAGFIIYNNSDVNSNYLFTNEIEVTDEGGRLFRLLTYGTPLSNNV